MVPGAVGNARGKLEGHGVPTWGLGEEPRERVVMLFEHQRGIVESAAGDGEVSGPGVDLNGAVTKLKTGFGGGCPGDEGIEAFGPGSCRAPWLWRWGIEPLSRRSTVGGGGERWPNP